MTLRAHLRRFFQDESGSASIELLIVLPLLAWIFFATFVFFDAFRAKSINVKATYTISDILSREVNEPITPEFMDSLYALYQSLIVHTRPSIQGIIIYGIGFEVTRGQRGEQAIQNCVSDRGRIALTNYFYAEGLQIDRVFRTIAAQINALKLVQ